MQVWALLTAVTSFAQYSPVVDGSPQSLLLSESKIDRPLLMHRSQLQINPGYVLSIINGTFDNGGTRTSFEKDGLSSTAHSYVLNVNYGLFEFLEINASLPYLSRTESSKDVGIVGYTDFTSVSSMTEWKGLQDMSVGFGIRPWTKKLPVDLALRLGCTLPTGSKYSKVPQNAAIEIDANNTQLDYHNFGNLGRGVPALNYGFDFRYRFTNIALNLSFLGSRMMGTSSSNDWIAQLDNYQFSYTEVLNKVQYPDQYQGLFSVDFKAFSWFDIYGGLNYNRESSGWKDISGIRYTLPQTSLSRFMLGYEILATQHLRILQQAQLPLFGKNSDSSFEIFTSLVYTLFTKK